MMFPWICSNTLKGLQHLPCVQLLHGKEDMRLIVSLIVITECATEPKGNMIVAATYEYDTRK